MIRKNIWWSFASFLSLCSALAYAGYPVNLAGGKCGDGEESQGGSTGDGGENDSDPIYLASGDYQRSETDLFIPGRGLDFEFTRMYRSRSSAFADLMNPHDGNNDAVEIGRVEIVDRSPLGIGWDHKYDMRIDIDENAGVIVDIGTLGIDPEPEIVADNEPDVIFLYDGTGRRDDFRVYTTHNAVAGNPALYANDKFASVIRYSVHNAYIDMFDENQVRYRFLPFYTAEDQNAILPYAGRLHSITDRNGNQLEFFYETSNGVERLAYMTDTLDHTINFYYHDNVGSPISSSYPADQVAHLLWQVVDNAGRMVEFEYENISSDYRARLISVTLPNIENTTGFPIQYSSAGTSIDHGRFPSGRKWQYEYATALPSSNWLYDGMLTKVTDPNGVVIIQNEYSRDVNNIDRRAYGRVIRQEYADEAYNYVWIDNENNLISQTSGKDYFVWVNDRRGAITRYKYSHARSSYGPGEVRDMQLLEKLEFMGFVDDPDLRVYAEYNSGSDTIGSWKQIDGSGNVTALIGTTPHDPVRTIFMPEDPWNNAGIEYPNGSTIQNTYYNNDYPPPTGEFPSPQFYRTVTSRTMSSPDGVTPVVSITESWRYDFDFGGGGCGCGSSSFETAYKDGNGYVTRKVYDTTADPLTGRANGNLLTEYHGLPSSYFTNTLDSNVSNDAASVDEYTYNQWGQTLTHIHPEKVILDSQGNPTAHRRVDSFDYYSDTNDEANYGRLHHKHIDINGLNLTTTYEYDLIGNIIKVTGPYTGNGTPNGYAGADVTEYLYNQASQLVRERHYDGASTLYAEKMYFYDANGNLVVEDELNLDGDQSVVADDAMNGETKWFTTVHVYDKLDFRTETSREKTPTDGIFTDYATASTSKKANSQAASGGYITQRWTYDANRNLTLFENGEAVSGGQASNVIKHEYDARDLRNLTIVGYGGTSPLKTAFEYDENGRVETKTVNPDGDAQQTSYVYDWFNRLISRSDPMGDETLYEYDDNHNLTQVALCGPILFESPSGTGETQVTLARVSRVYEELDLYTSQMLEVFDYDYSNGTGENCGEIPTGSTQQTTYFTYNQDSSLRQVDAPSGGSMNDITDIFYDTASRLEMRFDAGGNVAEYGYDADSNLISTTKTDYSTENGSVYEIYEVAYAYDAMDRRISMIDGVNNATTYEYDSRSNMIEMTDPRGTDTTYAYDSLGRLTSTSLDMGGSITIDEGKEYDDSSRLVSEIDDNGHATEYDYDGVNRVVKITMPDGAYYSIAYDDNGNPATCTDARGVVITQTFDLDNRLVARTINDSAVSGGLPGATGEAFTYDGLGRLRTADNDFAQVTREYDSRSNLILEVQNIDAASSFNAAYDREVEYGYDSANNNTQLTYPGGREVYRTYDELNRLVGIFNDAPHTDPVTEFEYVGDRIAKRVHGNGAQTAYRYDGHNAATPQTGDLGFGRVDQITTTNTSTSAILDAFTFTWDAAQNRTSYNDTGSAMPDRRERTFGYDPANRLVSTDADFPDPNTTHTAPTNAGVTTYTLDGVHNRTAVSGFEELGAPVGTYAQSGDQALNNQYTQTPRPAGGEWDYTYDANGNLLIKAQHSVADYNGDYTHNFFDMSQFMIDYGNGDPDADYNGDGQLNYADVSAFSAAYGPLDGTSLEHWHYGYDFRNQLVEISHRQGTSTLAETFNIYDALARRVKESIDLNADSTPDAAKQLVYGGVSSWEVLEQIDLLNDETMFTHVFGIGIDDEVSYRIEDVQTPEDYWSHRDDLGSLTSITDENGVVKERYEYGDYGDVRFFDASGAALTASVYLPQHLYTGRLVIGGTGLLDYRFRVLETETGRFVQRDPLGTYDTLNLYTYVSNNPTGRVDAFGLYGQEMEAPGGGGAGSGNDIDKQRLVDASIKNCGGGSICDQVRKKLKGWQDEYTKRVNDLNNDDGTNIQPSTGTPGYNLPERIGGDHLHPSTSRGGHRALIEWYKDGIKWALDFINRYCNGPGSPPPGLPAPKLKPFGEYIKPWEGDPVWAPPPRPVTVPIQTWSPPVIIIDPETGVAIGVAATTGLIIFADRIRDYEQEVEGGW